MMLKSLLDNDMYKFTMGQFVFDNYPNLKTKYKFHCRSNHKFTSKMIVEIRDSIEKIKDLSLNNDEVDYLHNLGFDERYIASLNKRVTCNFNIVESEKYNCGFKLEFNGPWHVAILWEVPILAIISEVYHKNTVGIDKIKKYEDLAIFKLDEKLNLFKDQDLCKEVIKFIDFGTRRRFSFNLHDRILNKIKHDYAWIDGTSNVYFAKKYKLNPRGTHAHELICGGQAIVHPLDGQKYMLSEWIKYWNGNFGIALTDTINLKEFLKDFDYNLASCYRGVRHDSGSPDVFADQIIEHYKKLGIDPRSKKIIFSDGLDFKKMIELQNRWGMDIHLGFGIGTNLTCDVPNIVPLQIVLKLVELDGKPIAKISDTPGKGMCEDKKYESWLKSMYGIK